MMKTVIVLMVAAFSAGCLGIVDANQDAKAKYLTGVQHFRQSTIRIQANKVIYFDPFQVAGEAHDADLVMITHTHGDHFSIPDLKKVINPQTILVITADAVAKAKEAGISKIVEVVPSHEYEVAGVKFKTVPAYNTNKQFHPKENKWVGYILYQNKISYYIAGDTDLIPEMKDIKVDVAFLPVGGTYTMTADEAAQAANLIKPKVAVPIHFGDVVGTLDDAKKFISRLDPKIAGVILKQ